jgi:hypothetical protein
MCHSVTGDGLLPGVREGEAMSECAEHHVRQKMAL